MNTKTEFLRIMAEQTEMALATSVSSLVVASLPTMLAVSLNLQRINCNQQTQVRFTTPMVVLLPTWELRSVRVHQQMKFQQL